MERNLLTILLFLSPAVLIADSAIPDFTQGDKLPEKAPHDWNLGPTGARGWVYGAKGESTQSRQILVTKVDTGSPSDGLLEEGDVILGLNGRKFSRDARVMLAKAITHAEATNGKLNLAVWRKGKVSPVTLTISRMGSYAATAPYRCKKSGRIFYEGCEAIAANLKDPKARKRNPIERSLNALALLASGKEEYLPLVQQEAEWAAQYELKDSELYSWLAGYVTLFLAEYILTTGDTAHLKNLERLAEKIAYGQSRVGSWGHRFAYRHNGILRGYGAMNQASLSLTMSLILAREAGVNSPAVDRAIDESQKFFRFYVGKGAIPYGDHHPWIKMHDDNGKNSAAAILFDFLDDLNAVQFFSLMAVSSYGIERESGHTGNFFNMLWALPGVSRAGPAATGAWVRETAWLLDLARTWKGEFDFLGKPGFPKGSEHCYSGWDCTGAYLLSYGLPLGKTRLTGSRKSIMSPLSKGAADRLIKEGDGWMPRNHAESYNERPVSELLNNLSSWSPVIRERAAIALTSKGDKIKTAMPKIVRTLSSPNPNTVLGACAALEHLGPRGADGVPALTRLLRSRDYWIQTQAAEALAGIGEPARTAIPELLKLAAAPRHPEDLRGYRQRYVAFALFDQRKGLLSKSLDGVDRDELRAGIRAVLANEDGRARSAVSSVFQYLDYEQIKPLLPDIHHAIVEQAPSGVMFSDGIRLAGLELLAEHNIAEGMPLCIQLVEPERWGFGSRFERCMKALSSYGAAAGYVMPELTGLKNKLKQKEKIELVQDTITTLTDSRRFPKLITLDGEPWKGTKLSSKPASLSAGAGVVRVFILAGQSNMEGHGFISATPERNEGRGSLQYLAEHSAAGSTIAQLLNINSVWRSRDDTWISYFHRKGPLTVGYGAKGDRIGPELGFGWVIGDAVEDPVLLIKCAWGGKSLGVDFRPPSAGKPAYSLGEKTDQEIQGNPDLIGHFYRATLEQVKQSLSNIRELVPGSDGRYVLSGFAWHQGWNDRINQNFVDEYKSNMIHFIRDMRRDLDAPKLPFVIAETGMAGPDEKNPRALALMKAQKAVANHPEIRHAAFVPTQPFWRPAEESPNQQGYHWNGNAETYYLIGESMGAAMKYLLQEQTTPLQISQAPERKGLPAARHPYLITSPPPDIKNRWGYKTTQYIHIKEFNIHVLGTESVSDWFMVESAHLIRNMVAAIKMPEDRAKFAGLKSVLVTDADPDMGQGRGQRNTGGNGFSLFNEALACAEAVDTFYPDEKPVYRAWNTPVHEFGHTIELTLGLAERSDEVFSRNAKNYNPEVKREYFAWAVQGWFAGTPDGRGRDTLPAWQRDYLATIFDAENTWVPSCSENRTGPGANQPDGVKQQAEEKHLKDIERFQTLDLEKLAGTYHRNPVKNKYHTGTITIEKRDAEGKPTVLRWTNEIGDSWQLFPEEASLRTGEKNPYYKFHPGWRKFEVVFNEDDSPTSILGFRFLNELYSRKPDP